jgi:hypothetical protein
MGNKNSSNKNDRFQVTFGGAYDNINEPGIRDCLPDDINGKYTRWNGKTCFGRIYPEALSVLNNKTYDNKTFEDIQDLPYWHSAVNNEFGLFRGPVGITNRELKEIGGRVCDSNFGWPKIPTPPDLLMIPTTCENLSSNVLFGKFAKSLPITYRCALHTVDCDGNGLIYQPETTDGCLMANVCIRTEWEENFRLPCCLGQVDEVVRCAPAWSDKAYKYMECDVAMSEYCQDNLGNTKCNDYCGTVINKNGERIRRTDDTTSFCYNYARNYCTIDDNIATKLWCRQSYDVVTGDTSIRPGQSEGPSWADEFVFGQDLQSGYCGINRNSTNNVISDFCSCYNSKLLNPGCTDTTCINKGYKNSRMWEDRLNCPSICQFVIEANNNNRTNVTFYDNTFINDCGEKNNWRPQTFYDLSGGVCTLKDGGRFSDTACSIIYVPPSANFFRTYGIYIIIGLGVIILISVLIFVFMKIFRSGKKKNTDKPSKSDITD